MEAWSKAVLESAGGRAWSSGDTSLGRARRACESDSWNSRFQACRAMGDASAFALTELNRDFVYVASTIARTIILERYVDDAARTIPAVDLGVAGGTKFASHGIFFKCVDGRRPPFYGDDDAAHKCVGHDLKGANAVLAARVPGIHVALQCVVGRGARPPPRPRPYASPSPTARAPRRSTTSASASTRRASCPLAPSTRPATATATRPSTAAAATATRPSTRAGMWPRGRRGRRRPRRRS